MRLVFVHDGPLFYDDNGKYYEFSYHGLYDRYKYLANEIVFLNRTQPLPKGEKFDALPEEVQVVGFKNFKSPLLYFKYIGKAEKIIAEEIRNADIVILRDSSSAGIALKYVKKYNIPYIHECVGCVWDSMWNHSLLGKFIAPFSFVIRKSEIKKASYVYYVTNEFLQKRYPTKGKFIGCSNVFIDPVDEIVLNNRLNKIKKLKKSDEIYIGTAAAIDVRYKGQEYVIKAMKTLYHQGYKIKYFLAGSNKTGSTYLKEISKRYGVEDNIVFCGSLDRKKMEDFYDSLDIYIQPSKQEGLPRSVIEAMSRGCPVLGTNIAGIPELLDTECLFNKGSNNAIAKSIVRILHSDMYVYAKSNFNKAKDYTIDKLDKRRKIFYDDFLAEYMSKNGSKSTYL